MASDDFTDDNGTALETHDANWTSIDGDYVVTEAEIQGNQCQAEGGFDSPSGYYSGSSEDTSEMVQVNGTDENESDHHVGVRMGDSQRGYSLNLGSGNGSEWSHVYVTKNGSYHGTAADSGTWSMSSSHTLKITVSGTTTVTIDTWIDGGALTQLEDSASPIGTGNPGFWTTEVNEVADSVYDDWNDGAAGGSAALTGTAVDGGVLESEIVTGTETIIITLTDDTWIAAGSGPIGTTANTQALINGIDGDVAGGTGWDVEVKANLVPADDVVRDTATQCTVTLNAAAGYAISSDETITVTIPAEVLTGGEEIVADATFVVTNETVGVSVPVAYLIMRG